VKVEQVSNETRHVSLYFCSVSLENTTDSVEVKRYSEWQQSGRRGSSRPPSPRLGTGQGSQGMKLRYAVHSMAGRKNVIVSFRRRNFLL